MVGGQAAAGAKINILLRQPSMCYSMRPQCANITAGGGINLRGNNVGLCLGYVVINQIIQDTSSDRYRAILIC